MKFDRTIFQATLAILCFICLPCTTMGEEEPVVADSEKPISALAVLLQAQNDNDLKKALTVARGEAAKAIAPSFANTSRMGIKFDTEKLLLKETKVDEEFSILTVGVTANRGDQSRAKDMLVVATEIEGKWVITYMDDDLSAPEKKEYQNTDAMTLESVEKDYEVWEKRFSR